MTKEKFMQKAIELAKENEKQGGQPYGAVIVKDGEIISTGVNQMHLKTDPTAHAELLAIQEAARKLNTLDLSDCELYASGEPCPMCLATIYWANIKTVYYAEEATGLSQFIYEEFTKPKAARSITIKQLKV